MADNNLSLDGIRFKPRKYNAVHSEITGDSHLSLEGIQFRPTANSESSSGGTGGGTSEGFSVYITEE